MARVFYTILGLFVLGCSFGQGLDSGPPDGTGIKGALVFNGTWPSETADVAVAVYEKRPQSLADFFSIAGWDTTVALGVTRFEYFVPLERPGLIVRSVLVFCLLYLPASSLWGDSGGTLSGQVTDAETGETLPGASVIILGTDLGVETGEDGDFRLPGLPFGPYSLSISMLGYAQVNKKKHHGDGRANSPGYHHVPQPPRTPRAGCFGNQVDQELGRCTNERVSAGRKGSSGAQFSVPRRIFGLCTRCAYGKRPGKYPRIQRLFPGHRQSGVNAPGWLPGPLC